MTNDEQRDRSLTVMIPRAKYRSAPQSPQNYKTTMSTFVTDEHKLINYLDNGSSHHQGNRKQSISSTKDCKESDLQGARGTPAVSTGALVSAGFQVFFINHNDKRKKKREEETKTKKYLTI